MQSSGLVLWLVAVACACEPCLASNSGSGHHRPRNTLLALVRAATALHHHPPLPQPSSPHHHHHHHLIPPLPANVQLAYPPQQPFRRHHVAAPGELPPEQLLPAAFRQHEQPTQLQQQQQQQPPPPPQAGDELQEQQSSDDESEKRRVAWSKRGGTGGGGGAANQLDDAPELSDTGDEVEQGQEEEAVAAGLQQVGASIASNFLRHARSGSRPYDVPRIDCPAAEDQMERFPCPSPDRMGRYRCIDDHVLCDGFIDCPDGEDEDRQQCMFYKTTKAHLDVLADAIIRWARGGK